MKAWGSKKIFRREEMPPLEPWQVDQFTGASIQRPQFVVPEPTPPEAVPEPEPAVAEAERAEAAAPAAQQVPMVDEEALESIKLAAREAGYQAGHAEGQAVGHNLGEEAGRVAGYASGYESGIAQGRAEADADVARFRALLDQLAESLSAYETQLTKPILDISLAVARQIVRSNLVVEPERVLSVIREAINASPELQGPLKIELHPDDLAIVQSLIAGDGTAAQWRLQAVAEIERGGCRIGNSNVELDLTLPHRWKRIVDTLGSDAPWVPDDVS